MSSINFDLNYDQCKEQVKMVLKAGLVPMIESAPGIGKSSMMREIAEELDLFLIDERISTREPSDMTGYVLPTDSVDLNGNPFKQIQTAPLDIWPLEHTPLPINPKTGQPYKGWLIFLDELRSATPAAQAACYRVLLDREIGNKKLHKRVLLAAASNRMEDNAVVHDAGTAMQSRLTWLGLRSDLDIWINNVAIGRSLDARVTAFVQWKGIQALNNFNPDHQEKTFTCERTWEMASKILKKNFPQVGPIPNEYAAVFVGTIGQSMALEFIAFTQIYSNLVTFDDIVQNPLGVAVDVNRPDIMFATVSNIQSNLNASNMGTALDPVMKFINRVGIEFQALVVQHILRTDPMVARTNNEVVTWISQKQTFLNNKRAQVQAIPMPPQPSTQDDDDAPDAP
jgi:hypothetical protein